MKIYNSLTKKKENFEPIQKEKVGIYVCGVTIYDRLHLGHARTFSAFDAIVRYLKYLEYDVNYIRNITDLDDKILNRARKENVLLPDLTRKYENLMHQDFDDLNLIKPNIEPRVTEHMQEIIEMIIVLMDKGFAYKSQNGDILFDLSKYKNYGKLSGQIIENNSSEFNDRKLIKDKVKENEADFVLWKSVDNEDDVSYDAPFGQGRPGWHIECSAMSKAYLGSNFDIHGGGNDLKFPHHENEIAQSVAANGEDYANYWMHTGMITVDGVKMSKSLGNFVTIEDMFQEYDPEAVKLFLLSSHYRSDMDYSLRAMNQAVKNLDKIYRLMNEKDLEYKDIYIYQDVVSKFKDAMNNDFNTPLALSVLYSLAGKMSDASSKEKNRIFSTIKHLSSVLGLWTKDANEYFESKKEVLTEDIKELINKRNLARENKDFKEADRIRDILIEKGISINDKRL